MDLKYYFDFNKCWNEIINEYKDDNKFDNDRLEDIEDKRIAGFIKKQIPIDLDECYLSGDDIFFCFSEEYQTANESYNQNEFFMVLIGYNSFSEEFTHYSQEQG